MPRARLLKPGFFKNEELARLSERHRLLFAGLWTLADREGRLEDRPERIKGELFPYEVIDIEPLLVDLARRGFIVRYSYNPTRSMNGHARTVRPRAIAIPTFLSHQTPHIREAKSLIPPPTSKRVHRDSSRTNDSTGLALAQAGSSPAVPVPVPVSGDRVSDPEFDPETEPETGDLTPTLSADAERETASVGICCGYCGATAEQTGRLLESDHFLPRHAGGSDDPSNRLWACHVCNQAKQGRIFKTVEEARAWLHAAYWQSNRQRWVHHRQFAFGGLPPADVDTGRNFSRTTKQNIADAQRLVARRVGGRR